MKLRRPKGKTVDSEAVDPALDPTALQNVVVEIMAEEWRFKNAVTKAAEKMDVMEAERFRRQYAYFSDRVLRAAAASGLTCLDLTGQPYDVGMAVQAMNLEEFDEEEPLIVSRMIEPIILSRGRVMKRGIVMLSRRADS